MAKHPNYELFEELGRGENSIVYRAWDLALSRDVAIKELKSDPGSDGGKVDASRIKQFLQEASFLAQFEHENVLRIHTVDQERGWIVMELMKGSLTNQIETEPMDPDTVRSVLRQMLTALDFLHKKDKVHGAVRPSNILINELGTVKLSDFEASSRDGELRVPKGSKKYLAPELIRAEFGRFGPAVDLYCLGFTALELLTGKNFDSLFPGTGEGAIDADVAWLRWHSSDEPMKPVSEIATTIPDDLSRVIDELLNKSVEDRPADAAAVLKLLDDAPLVPVAVPQPKVAVAKPDDVAAILPSPAVKLREMSPKKPVSRNRNRSSIAENISTKDRLNETLGKPWVLWPICIAMLSAAAFVGLQLRGDRGGPQEPVAAIEKATPIDESSISENLVEPKALAVKIRVLPDADRATLRIAGEDREFDGLALLPGQHEVIVEKDGFERFASTVTIDEENTDFDVTLQPVAVVEVRPLSLEKNVARFELPSSLLPKPGGAIDQATGLPLRAMARVLQDTAPLELALVSAGSYRCGVPETDRRTWEVSLKTIQIENPFYIGVHEVTNAQQVAFLNSSGAEQSENLNANELPCVNVSVKQAAEFCAWAGGRLPNEQQWEAAVRGVDDSGFPLPWGSSELSEDKYSLFRGGSPDEQSPVAVASNFSGANEIGLLNSIGNVSEWCDDQHGAEEFIVKGCSFRIPPGDHVRVSWRSGVSWTGADDVGLRLMVPVVAEMRPSEALAFTPPTNINSLLVSIGQDRDRTPVQTKTVAEIADQFTGPAELVIDSGGFIDEVQDVCFSPDGKRIAVGGGKVVRIWNVETGTRIATLRGDMSRTSYGNVNAVAWSPDGKHLVVGVSDYRQHGNIRVYETSDFGEIQSLLAGHTAPCRKLCFSRDGQQLASADADGLVLVRDWNTREITKRIPPRDTEKPILDALKFPTNSPVLLSLDFDGPQVFSTVTGEKLGSNDAMPEKIRGWLVDVFNKLVKQPYDAKGQPRVLDFRMEEGRWAGAGSGIENGRSRFWVRVWQSRAAVAAATPTEEIGAYDQHRWKVTAVALQPGGSLVASADKFGEVHVWDSTTGKRKFKFAGQGKPIYEVAFDENSSRLAFGTRPFQPDVWNRNNHGAATRVLDLKLRGIADVASREDLQLRNEQVELGGSSVNVRKRDAAFFVEHKRGAELKSQYRISSGRNPTVFTLLDEPKLGIDRPVVFGDGEGLLAMWDSAGDELKRAFIGHAGLVSAVSTASNGKLLASASTDRTIRLWSLENYKPTGIFDFKYENSAVREVVPGTSSSEAGVQVGDRIVAVDGKSLTEVFDLMLLGQFDYVPGQRVPVKMKRGQNEFEYSMEMADGYDFAEPILNFYMGDEGQWIIWHPQGYYDASPGADRLIGWHLNRGHDKSAEFFEVQQFRDKLYRPDVISGILDTGSLDAALAALRVEDTEKEVIDFRETDVIAQHYPPSVRIISPTDRWQTESATVTVTGEATSVNGLPITALTLLHNGSVAKVFRPTQVNQLRMEFEYDMQLSPGANDLVLIAANSKSSSQGEHIVVDLKNSIQDVRPNAIVLAIGVSDFTPTLGQFKSAQKDATAFVASMKAQQNGRLYGDVTTKLLAGSVSDSEILEGFQWLSDNVENGDVAIVYVASKGIVDRRDNFYIAATNSNEMKARSTAVSWRDLTDTLQLDLPGCKRMVFLDLEPTDNSIRSGLRNPLLDLAAPEMGTIFLSSNTLQQKSVQLAEGGKGAFLQAVLETVSDSQFDTNPDDSFFNPVELAAGVTTRVKSLTQDKQQPIFFTPEFAKSANVFELRN